VIIVEARAAIGDLYRRRSRRDICGSQDELGHARGSSSTNAIRREQQWGSQSTIRVIEDGFVEARKRNGVARQGRDPVPLSYIGRIRGSKP